MLHTSVRGMLSDVYIKQFPRDAQLRSCQPSSELCPNRANCSSPVISTLFKLIKVTITSVSSSAVTINWTAFCSLGNHRNLPTLFVLSLIKFAARIHNCNYLGIGGARNSSSLHGFFLVLFTYL